MPFIRLVANCELGSWQEVLAALVVYCDQHRYMPVPVTLKRSRNILADVRC
jgi:hypothetical protein